MTGNIKLVTSPDIVYDQSYTITIVCPSEDLKSRAHEFLSTIKANVTVYFYTGQEKDIKWLLTVSKMSDTVILDIDNCPGDVVYFISYLLTLPSTHYKCNHLLAPWSILNSNRFYDFPTLTCI